MGLSRMIVLLVCLSLMQRCNSISLIEKSRLKDQVKEMFLHAYNSYKMNAYPADELMPLSCKGRIRNQELSRGDVDDALGNFSLTMIDTLDSLFLFNELDEFEAAVQMVIRDVHFDSDLDVSVFETNIRVLGGLLGAHVSALEVKKANQSRMVWYKDQLLKMAVDIGTRLLPAFNTSTGIPLPRVNLKHGSVGLKQQQTHTCTACAGTMILEFAALSRFTGNPIFEEKAARALAYLWKQRSQYSDLVGSVIDVRNGDWIKRESGIGAGIDSYYEYLLKAYVLLGEPVYLHRFLTHYEAVKRYVGVPQSTAFPFLFLDVNMHKPSERVRLFMDSLFAFWPGLQVLLGDVKPAIALHEFLFQAHKRNKLLPEAFTPDMRVHWGEHLIRPELVESTYLLHQATGDPYYLDVGARLVHDLQTYARVPCGFAAIKDVRTMDHIDRFDSFVLAETFKYLYLLFANESDLPINMKDYVFTTEAHILPLALSQLRYPKALNVSLNTSICSEPDHHGDRDLIAEANLHQRGQCAAVYYEHELHFRRSRQCSADSHSTDSPSKPDGCSVLEGAGVLRGAAHLFTLTSRHAVPRAELNSCPAAVQQWLWSTIDQIRGPARQISSKVDPETIGADVYASEQQNAPIPLLLKATEFQPNNLTQMALLKRMGVEMDVNSDSRVVIKHDQNVAESPQLALAGLVFIQDLVKITKSQAYLNPDLVEPRHVVLLHSPLFGRERLSACPANFALFPGESDTDPGDWQPVVGPLRLAEPFDACQPLAASAAAYPSVDVEGEEEVGTSKGPIMGSIGVVGRGGCLFVEKARHLAQAGAIGGIVLDSEENGSSFGHSACFTMSGSDDGSDRQQRVRIPFVLLLGSERERLLTEMRRHWTRTGQPAVAMITKQFNATQTISLAFEHLKDPVSSPDSLTPVSPGFRLSWSVRRQSASGSSLVRGMPTRDAGFLSVHREPASVDWFLTLFLPMADWPNLFVQDRDDATASTVRSVPQWIDRIKSALDQVAISEQCSGLLLSLVESVLELASESPMESLSPTPIELSASWTSAVEECLDRVSSFKPVQIPLPSSPESANLESFSGVSIQLNLQQLV